MSYDIYLNFKNKPSQEEVMAYFENRRHYTVDGPGRDDFFYSNSKTSVYFLAGFEGEEYDFYFSVNLVRPHFFILEFTIELKEFITRFPSVIIDHQVEIEESEFNAERLIEDWWQTNVMVSQSMNADGHLEARKPVQTALLDQYWRWNYQVAQLESEIFFGVDVFIPRLWLYQSGEKVEQLSFWPNGVCVVLPRNMNILVGKDKLLSDGLNLSILPYDRVSDVLEKYALPQSNENYIGIFYEKVPDDIKKILRKGCVPCVEDSMIKLDTILNEVCLAKKSSD